MFGAVASLGVTAGASAPEVLVEEIIDAFAERYTVNVETVTTAEENMFFPLPRAAAEAGCHASSGLSDGGRRSSA